jgi:hypothetical protein
MNGDSYSSRGNPLALALDNYNFLTFHPQIVPAADTRLRATTTYVHSRVHYHK